MSDSLKIGITDCGKFDNYRRWIEAEGAEVIKLSRFLDNAAETNHCDGIIFSGGEDVHPELYGRPEYVNDFGLVEIMPERDRYEYEVLSTALAADKPVLGICRGLQLINVFLGGTLVPDIQSLFRSGGHGKIDGLDQHHPIEVEEHTMLSEITRSERGIVNSAHHQSADQPADGLKISAYSEPDIVEAMEWKNRENKSWLLMLQWHPERMTDLQSPFSFAIKKAFLKACQANSSGLS